MKICGSWNRSEQVRTSAKHTAETPTYLLTQRTGLQDMNARKQHPKRSTPDFSVLIHTLANKIHPFLELVGSPKRLLDLIGALKWRAEVHTLYPV